MIKSKVASFSLGFVSSVNPEVESSVIFGGIDHDQYVGNLTDFPLVTDDWWAI